MLSFFLVFVVWPSIGRLGYTYKTCARSAAGGAGGRSEVEAAYAAGNEPRSTPPGDAELDAANRRTALRLRGSVKGRWFGEQKGLAMRQAELPAGRFRYESGSYGGPGRSYMPSILCYKQL